MAFSECILQGAKKDGSRRVQNRDCRDDEGEQSTQLSQGASLVPKLTGVPSGVVMREDALIQLPVWPKTLNSLFQLL